MIPKQLVPLHQQHTSTTSPRLSVPELGALALATLAVLACGCSWVGRDGTRHTVILGVGVVSSHEQTGITVREARGLGVLAEVGGFNAGLFQTHTVEIDPARAANAIVSIDATPFSLVVDNRSNGVGALDRFLPEGVEQ